MENDYTSLKKKMRGNGNHVLGNIFRRISIRLSMIFLKFNIMPNTITWFSFLLILFTIPIIIIFRENGYFVISILIILSYILDFCDGEVARALDICSNKGKWLDSALDRLKEFIIISEAVLSLIFGNNLLPHEYILCTFSILVPLYAQYISEIAIQNINKDIPVKNDVKIQNSKLQSYLIYVNPLDVGLLLNIFALAYLINLKIIIYYIGTFGVPWIILMFINYYYRKNWD
ncbi:phosphatidylglycerophosphate synthase [Methanococcus maripaludis]|uniref:Phosphatidylglycerophosphate synthase n=1 Tax=Methanococcus maripaludis TaxID=39152 RepID=A0A7J9NGY2_METMI|nr:CDP-alcohol phosphatidyltransferase family protein [Methanococcus maripaludis]MBA2840124.1 phosphatidylglycerophosphate synthase [Methanococcus maripaludis]